WRAAGEVASRLVSRARPVQRGSMMSEFPAQPPPTAQSVLWRPAIQELAPPEGDTSLIFIAQRTLAAVEDHLVGAPHRPLLGYLVGRVLRRRTPGCRTWWRTAWCGCRRRSRTARRSSSWETRSRRRSACCPPSTAWWSDGT